MTNHAAGDQVTQRAPQVKAAEYFEKDKSSEDNQESNCSCRADGAGRMHGEYFQILGQHYGNAPHSGPPAHGSGPPLKERSRQELSEVQTELNTLYARSEAINLAERKRERKASLTGGLMEAGLSVLGAGPIAEIGSSRVISNVCAFRRIRPPVPKYSATLDAVP